MMQTVSGDNKGDILIVDDDLSGLRLLSNLLTENGHEVRSARDGPTALMLASAEPPDLVLLDIQMSEMDGYQVCTQLKLNPATENIPVLFISARGEVLDKIKGFEVGGVDYINKPYHAEEILARIRTHLTISRLHSELLDTNTKLQEEILLRKQAQIALQESEASLRAQYEGIPIPTTTWKRMGDNLILVDYNQAAAANARTNIADLLGVNARDFFQDQRDIVEDMYLCLGENTSINRELEYTYRSTGETGSLSIKYAYVPPDLILVHYEDITARKQAENQLVKRLNELSALHHISKTIATKREFPQALEAVCNTVNDLLDTRLTFIALQENDSTELKGLIGFERSSGTISLARAETTLLDSSILQSTQSEGKSRLIANLQSMPVPESVREYVLNNNLLSTLIVPLISRSIVLGYLILAKDESGSSSFEKNEIDLAETIATDIAVAIENDRLTEQARLAAVDAERQRLARELHDSVTQSIYSLTLLSSGWESMARQGTLDDPAGAFHRLGAVGQQALKEMRLLLHQLRPSALEEGLVKAIQQRLDTVERRSNIDAQLIVQADLRDLPQKVENELFYITQEALNNSLRHAMAESVRILIEENQGVIELSIKDDGIGFEPSTKHAGMGLRNMLERARDITGELSIASEPQHGTCVKVLVNIHKDAPEK